MRRMSLRGVLQLIAVLVLIAAPLVLQIGQSSALQLTDRSVTISTPTPSAVASHTFQMTFNSTAPIGSIVFEYCSNSPLLDIPCIPPSGLSLSGAVLAQQTGNTGFTIDTTDSTATQLVISRPVAAEIAAPSSYTFTNVINPSTNSQATFVRITTYNSTQGTGSYTDNGSVAFETLNSFEVGAYVPPFLGMCVGVTVAADCSQATGDSLDLGTLNAQNTKFGTSQYAASTNADTGCSVYVLGTTMTSGNNVIPSTSSPQVSQAGVSQFGINLRQNNNPIVGLEPSGIGSSVPSSNYNSPNLFSFTSGSQLSNSPISTAYNRMTVSYIINISASQPAGVYSTTLTYLAAAQF